MADSAQHAPTLPAALRNLWWFPVLSGQVPRSLSCCGWGRQDEGFGIGGLGQIEFWQTDFIWSMIWFLWIWMWLDCGWWAFLLEFFWYESIHIFLFLCKIFVVEILILKNFDEFEDWLFGAHEEEIRRTFFFLIYFSHFGAKKAL